MKFFCKKLFFLHIYLFAIPVFVGFLFPFFLKIDVFVCKRVV